MITLLVLSPAPGDGKTGVLAAVALHHAYQGVRVLALRLGDAGHPAAVRDAATLAALPFARGRGGRPVTVDEARALGADAGRPVDVFFLEADAGPEAERAAQALDARVLLVGRGGGSIDDLRAAAAVLGQRLRAVVITAVPQRRVGAVREAALGAGLPVLAVLPEDRTLYAPSLGDLIDTLDAEVILGEPDTDQTIEHILINPVTADPGQPYYARLRNKAVITRSDKTDLQLAALQTQTDVLILTGGMPPSPYTIDRAAGEEVPLLLTRTDTVDTAGRLEDIYTRSRFAGETKVERMLTLIREAVAPEDLSSLIAE